MDKKYAFLIALAITILIAINHYLFSIELSPEREIAKLSRVIDGDTIELEDGRKIRLLNINTPEKNQPNSELAINFLKNYENSSIELEIVGADKYNRALARIYVPEYLNLELVKNGMASKFLVEDEETDVFAEAEEEAIKSSLGIWQKSQYYNCLKSRIDEINEKIIMANNCNNLNITAWTLKDESTKKYQFKDIQIGEITLHTGKGEDNSTDIFWNSDSRIWNNDRDTLYLFDKEWKIVHYNSYGY